MTASLASAVKRFCNHSRRLQTILEDTKRCFDDINERATSENGQQVFNVELLQEEESEVLCTSQKQPGIVILGQNAYCKSRVVNEIFKRTIFPTFDNTDDKTKFRMVRFKHGDNLSVSLALPGDYALLENLEGHNGPWNTIPRKDLEFQNEEDCDTAHGAAVLEVSVNHQLLRFGCVVVVSECNTTDAGQVTRCIENLSPIMVYAFQSDALTTKEIQELDELKQITHFQPICFVKVPNPWPPDSQVQMVAGGPFHCSPVSTPKSPAPEEKFDNFEYMLQSSSPNTVNVDIKSLRLDSVGGDSRDIENQETVIHRHGSKADETSNLSPTTASHRLGRVFVSSVPPTDCTMVFKQLCGIGYLTDTPGVRNISRDIVGDYFEVDSVLVSNFDQLISSFTTFLEQTLQRYLVNSVTVLNNTHKRCLQTFIISAFDMARDMLVTPKKLEFAREREEELYKSLLQIAVDKGDEIKDMIAQTIAANWEKLVDKANEYDFIGVDFGEKGEILTPKGLKICTGQIQELVLGGLNQAVAGKLVSSVDILRDSYTGTLTRCLESLEKVERENPATTQALKQILNAAYQVEITVRSSSTLIHFLLERMKQIVQMTYRLELSLNTSSAQVFRRKMEKLVQAMPWSNPPRIDDEWKKKVAAEMLASLSAGRLAKSISSQIKDRLNKSHEAFSSALKQLETKHCGRLDKIEEERLKLRKYHAPRVAKLALESTSLKDHILHGTPVMGKEIGRGQYGVVYSCDNWAGNSPCAIKSVVPPDDKHWNDLALEFFYTKNIPEHDRIVALKGSVIDYSYGGGTTPAVLLVMDRLQRDLYTAIKQHLDWVGRLQVSIDVIEGIRFLHSQGLVHRDIKLKNVLLDDKNRGKITDLGFCKPEAMMSGSIVGTPIHMAPELFTGRYDCSVDVYAFGILFWYICAGSVRLPTNFEQCANKDQLWNNVKKGLRPEQLPVFDDDSWNLMSDCWESEPSRRPLLGEVQQKLSQIYDRYKSSPGLLKTAKDGPSYKSGKPLKYKIK